MIELRNLSFRYGRKPILQNCSHIIPNAAVCIGSNGCGKTTLLRLIAGILKPDNGEILCNAKTKFSVSLLQNTNILFDTLTISQHFNWIQQHASLNTKTITTHIENFNITPLLNRRPTNMSQGERQWASLALTCLMPADLLLLDEPFQHLDAAKSSHLCKRLNQMANAQTHILLTAHAPIPELNIPTWQFPVI
jgi:ABC-type multidrug transport system ATPase subunit